MEKDGENPDKEKTLVPLEEGYFTIPISPGEEPHLIGSKCRSCGEYFFPKRVFCAKCFAEDSEEVLLSRKGKLYTYTRVHVPMFGKVVMDRAEYCVGQVDLPEGPRIQTTLNCDPGELKIDMEMELILTKINEDKQGNDIVVYQFRPHKR
jgi:uncharacterized OB-fold protein